ncbi:MAG: dTMP kinase [Deltaproteobacteria bacterium]|nr:dTMP kinase [Deltaproteobacteria bacterium]
MALFITLEGIEGSGKSTQTKLLAQALEKQGASPLVTREPGGSLLGQDLRKILVQGKPGDLSKEAELFLYLADRAQHVDRVIKPALASDKIVLCDRFTDSTLAYQGYARGLDLENLKHLNLQATQGLQPDLSFLLDCPAEVGLKRSHQRLEKELSSESRFEKEDLSFHQKVREGFLKLAQSENQRFVIVDGQKDPELLHQILIQEVQKRLSTKK